MVAYNNYSRKPVCLSALRPVTPKTMPATGNERWRFNVSVEGDTHQMKKALPGPSLMSIYVLKIPGGCVESGFKRSVVLMKCSECVCVCVFFLNSVGCSNGDP